MAISHRLQLLNPVDYEHYYGFPHFGEQERAYYFQLSPEEMILISNIKEANIALHVHLQLGYFKAKQRLFSFTFADVKADIRYLCRHYNKAYKWQLPFPSRNTIKRDRKRILETMGYTDERDTQTFIKEKLPLMVRQLSCPSTITKELIRHFEQKGSLYPDYSTLQDSVGAALRQEEKRLSEILKQQLMPSDIILLNQLLTADEQHYPINDLQYDPKNFNHKQLKAHIDLLLQYDTLYQATKRIVPKLTLSNSNIEYYASLIDFYNAYELSALEKSKAWLYIICYMHYRLKIVRNHLIESFLHHSKTHEEAAKEFSSECYAKAYSNVSEHFENGATLLRFFNDKTLGKKLFDTVCKKAHGILPAGNIEQLSTFFSRSKTDNISAHWQYYRDKHQAYCKNLRPLFVALEFDYAEDCQSLKAAVTTLKMLFNKGILLSQYPQAKLPKQFIPKPLRDILVVNNTIDVYQYEALVYQQLADKTHKGKVTCDDSTQYRDFDREIKEAVNWEDAAERETLIKELDVEELSVPIETLLAGFETEINTLYEEANTAIISGDNPHLKYTKTDAGYDWNRRYTRTKDAFNNPFYDNMPREDIGSIIDFVDGLTDCLSAIKPIKTKDSSFKPTKSAKKGTLIAIGSGLGIFKLSERSDLLYQSLYQTRRYCFTIDNIQKTNDKVVNPFGKLPIYEYYQVQDQVGWANADGSKYRTQREVFKSRHSSKYFALSKGVVSYSSIMNYVAIATKVIGANEHESHHLPDLIANQTTDLGIDCVATDNEGVNRHQFLLSRCLGIEFAPCYRKLSRRANALIGFKDVRCYQNDKYIVRPARKLNKKKIIDRWEDAKPIIAASLVNGTDLNVLVRKLSSTKRDSKVQEAMEEFNAILVTRHVLRYIHDPNLAAYIRTTLNRGEAYHQLHRKIVAIGGGRYRGKNDREIALSNECARLIANIVIFYNAYMLSALIEIKKEQGDWGAVAFLSKLSPIACQHINFGGLYKLATENKAVDVDSTLALLNKILKQTLG